ncbi:hypothetical protein P3551_21015 [Vibrio parahaemolyticus]|uniref:hypothetical protein n=1 Tax=Vibrio parahaemolyticus TaxID=670 RepID=UPI001124A7B4|nr:hypothetical protein [Vibrio parahaemolyticus]MBE3985674.1 hypothetical protein [Vibrio parahaemolyticus]MBE4286449.1 hypothetical protein [Vibrio parahaemolyticus]MDF4901763.1 hypothetical protein [Vibrio parahaemolyticus]TOH18941.1 hypothetical protein CGI90_04280 [Vibrio parahaemolyticus]HCG7330489.1 hypothetical protein [Vibrio parahaemolyticus]
MIDYYTFSAVSAAALVLGWMYYQERQRRKESDEIVREANSFSVIQITLEKDNIQPLWMYELGRVTVLFDKVIVRGYDLYLMERGEIKAKLGFDIFSDKVDFSEAVNELKLNDCPIEDYCPDSFQ